MSQSSEHRSTDTEKTSERKKSSRRKPSCKRKPSGAKNDKKKTSDSTGQRLTVPTGDQSQSETEQTHSASSTRISESTFGFSDMNVPMTMSKKRRARKRLPSMAVINYEQLCALRQAFLDRWDGEDLGLTKEEFQKEARETINLVMTDEEVERMFKQTDLKGSGVIRWCDYITSISQTAQLRAYMAAEAIKPLFQDKMDFQKTKHRDEIVSIRFIPRLSLQSTKVNYRSGRYLMLGRWGNLSMWTLDLTYIGAHYIGAPEGHGNLFFIDMAILYPSTLIAVTSTDRKIVIYELGSRGIQEKYSIVTLGNCVTCLDFWSNLRSRTSSLLVWGDTAGDIHSLEFNVNRLGGIFGKDRNQEIISRVVYADLVKNKFPTAYLSRAVGVHDDWVTAVKYIPENKAFLSSSRSSNRQAMRYSDWNGKVESRYFLTDKAVLCFDYSHVLNILITGSLDCRLRIWNFFMGQRPCSTLTHHTSPITNLVMNPSTQHVISVDKSRAIKVIDYLEGTVIQNFSGPSLQCMGGRVEITGFFFNSARCQLIVATTMLASTTKWVNPPYMAEISAHQFPISALCYSSAFGEILTACCNAVISVWDVHTGRHVLEFKHFSPRSHFEELPWAKDNVRLEITSMALDTSERIAFTGSNDGTVNQWNFSTGVLLSYYTLPDKTLVTGLCYSRTSIYASGWFRQVYVLNREQKNSKEPLKFFNRYHREEVNCIALVKGGLIATASYDGDIAVMSRDTGHPVCLLNPGESTLPMPMRGYKENPEEQLLLVGESESSGTEYSEEELFTTEDCSIMRCIRISDDLVMVSNAITGEAVKIVHKPRVHHKKVKDDMVFDPLKGRKVTKEESAATFKAYESSVEVLLCLESRKHLEINTANLLTAGAEGWIRAWSLNPKGGLKGQFLATEYLGEAVKAMTTDKDNDFLITGDTMGYIKVWDMFSYCNAAAKRLTEDERQARRDMFTKMFIFLRSPFLRDKASEGFLQCQKFNKRRPNDESDPKNTLRTPNLLNVFRAHMQAITCMQYVNEHQLILSGGKDCSVRVWTLKGSFVGQCGAAWVKLPDPRKVKLPLRVLPRDIRRNASARTFRVINAGCVPLWDHAMKCVKNYLEEQRKQEEKRASLEAKKAEKGEDEDPTGSLMLTQPIPLGPEGVGLTEDMRLSSMVHFNWEDPKRSRRLGKAFKPNLHHRRTPEPRITLEAEFGMFPAYRKITVSEIAKLTRIPTPQMIKDMDARRREEEEEAQRWRQGRVVRSKTGKGGGKKKSCINPPDISFSAESNAVCSPPQPPAPASTTTINNSAINTSCNQEDGEVCLDNLGDSAVDRLDLGLCDTAEGNFGHGRRSAVSTDLPRRTTSAEPRQPAEEAARATSSSPLLFPDSLTNTMLSPSYRNFSEDLEVTEENRVIDSDVVSNVLEDAADVGLSAQDADDDLAWGDNCLVSPQSCVFPPLTPSKQLTGTNTGESCEDNQSEPQSTVPKLPALQATNIRCCLFRGTGLTFGR